MGYSRANSPLVTRASRPQPFSGSADAGSTCSPSIRVLATALDILPLSRFLAYAAKPFGS
jgi:hypothetical protein